MSQSRTVHEKALPNWQRAVIDRSKLEGYVPNPTHPKRRHKAIVFKSALGFEQSDWETFRTSIIAELPYFEAVLGKTDRYGTRYNVTILITGRNGRSVNVLTAWIVETGKTYPSFVTALVE